MIITKRAQNNLRTDAEFKPGQWRPRRISIYDESPEGLMAIDQFQACAVSRLQVLKKIQFLYDSAKDNDADGMAKEINAYLRQHKLNVEGDLSVRQAPENAPLMRIDSDEARNDNVSHFICRLSYCRNDDLKKWFVQQECRLFHYRLDFFTSENKLDFLKEHCEVAFEQLHPEHEDWSKFGAQIAFNLESKLRKRKIKSLAG